MSERDSKGRFCKAEPRAFKVGDRVRHVHCRPNEVGTVTHVHGDSIEVAWPESGWSATDRPDVLCHAEPAPQPKAEEGKMPPNPYGLPITSIHKAQDGRVLGVTYGEVLDAHAKDAEIATLKAEVDRLTEELEIERQDNHTLIGKVDRHVARAESAEAKLDDIKALLRAMKIMSQTPGDEPSFQDAMWHIVEN